MKRKTVMGIFFVVVIGLFFFILLFFSTSRKQEIFAEKIYSIDNVDAAGEISYGIYSSHLLDTYYIACAIYFDFESNYVVPMAYSDGTYEQVKSTFMKYQNHAFVKSMEKYADTNFQSDLPEVTRILAELTVFGIDNDIWLYDSSASPLFGNQAEFEEFLTSLIAFYNDTNMKQFLKTFRLNKAKNEFLADCISSNEVKMFLNESQRYLNNGDLLFDNNKLQYCSLVTVFRPYNASYSNMSIHDSTYLLAILSLNKYGQRVEEFDYNQFFISSNHEFLHSFINPVVYEQKTSINQILADADLNYYDLSGNNPIYINLPFEELFSENIVRAVQGGIYFKISDNEEEAYNQILRNELEAGGMTKLKGMYESLRVYEGNRDKFISINDYIIELLYAVVE